MLLMKKVYSSHVNEVGYDAAKRELHVIFQDGQHAVYDGVPADKGYAVVNAPSVGGALHREIKATGGFPHRYV